MLFAPPAVIVACGCNPSQGIARYPRDPSRPYDCSCIEKEEVKDGYTTPRGEKETIRLFGQPLRIVPNGTFMFNGKGISMCPFDNPPYTRPTKFDKAITHPSHQLDALLGRYDLPQTVQRSIMIEGLGYHPSSCGTFATPSGFVLSLIEDIVRIKNVFGAYSVGKHKSGDLAGVLPALWRWVLSLAGPELVPPEAIQWLAATVHAMRKLSTDTSVHVAHTGGLINQYRRAVCHLTMNWANQITEGDFRLGPETCGELPIMLQMLIGAHTSGNYAVGAYEGEEDGEDRQEFMMEFLLANAGSVKTDVREMAIAFKDRTDIHSLPARWWRDIVFDRKSITDETGFENGFFAACGIERRG